jgi:hypothetical protein
MCGDACSHYAPEANHFALAALESVTLRVPEESQVEENSSMKRLLMLVIVIFPLAFALPEPGSKAAKDTVQKRSRKANEKDKTAMTQLTGCLDQQGDTYILRELGAAAKIATLKGKAFSDDNFARYVGHKVTVHGTLQKDAEAAVLHVTKVDDSGPGCSR